MLITSISEAIGKTPLLNAGRFSALKGINGELLAKLEAFNPAGSAKDRIAKRMIEIAEQEGKLRPGAVIIEPTSGNTGIGLAAIAAERGYRAVFVMPETMSVERQKLLAAFGAEIVLTPGEAGMQGSIDKALALEKEIAGAFIPSQFTNCGNAEAHYLTTGPELWQDASGKIDIFVATVGTGGTLSGTGRYLKEQNPDVHIVAVEPASSPLLSKGWAGPHKIQGIGANFIPETLDKDIIDEIIAVEDEKAFQCAREFARTEGFLVGISAGAALQATVDILLRKDNKGKRAAVILTDSGERYLSTELYK